MSKEFKVPYATGQTLYGVLMNQAGQLFNTSTPAFETVNGAHIGNYAITLTEAGTLGLYFGDFPSAIAAGTYYFIPRLRAGGSPADGDANLGGSAIYWSGAAELPVSTYTGADTAGTTTLLARLTQAILFDGGGNVKSDPELWGGAALPSMASPAAIVAAIQAAGVFTFNVTSPVLTSATISIQYGDDYFSADNRAFAFGASAGIWPNLTGATVSFNAVLAPGATTTGSANFTRTVTVDTPGTGAQAMHVEIPNSVTSALAIGNTAYNFSIVATLADGHIVTLVKGTIAVAK